MRKLGNVIFWSSAALSIIVLAAGLNLAFTDYTDGVSYDTALTVIARDGVHAATTRAIVAEAGMALASFHYAFRSRDELI